MNQFICVAMLLSITQFTSAVAQEPYPLRTAVECHPRQGLSNFVAGIEAGAELKIAYLGGSITAAEGWRVQSRKWFEEQYPQAKFQEIHAAIGGTGSDLGVFRLYNDVLRHDPDLMLVEFAVNDGGASPEQIHKAMEGIVRQTWRTSPKTDICFVYTLSEPMLPDLRSGKMQRSASAMEELADHYGIPSIHFGVKVVEMEAAGDLIFKADKPDNLTTTKPLVFSTDGVHPHVETGHRLYTAAIARCWPAIRDAGGDAGAHALIEPLHADNWQHAKQVAITPEMLRGKWRQMPADESLSKRFARNMPQLYQATEPESRLEFLFSGTTASVFDLLGPDGGRLSVQLDDWQPVTKNRIDGYCTYHRMSRLEVARELTPGRHQVQITLLPDKLDKREILFERNREFFDRHKDQYAEHTWYVSSLLIIGEIIPADE